MTIDHGARLGVFSRKLWVLMCAFALGLGWATASLAWIKAPNMIVVTHDIGGPVVPRFQRIATMRSQGMAAAIPYGTCISACTLYLGLPDTCVGRSAIFGFHGPSAATSGLGLTLADFERISVHMANHYPAPVRDWFLSVARYTTGSYLTVTGAQLIQYGVRECV